MFKMFRTIPIIIAVVLLFAGNVFAWSIDITPAYGDQDVSDILASPGDQIMYQLWFNPDATGTTFNMANTWRCSFDESELDFDLANSTQYAIGMPYQWMMRP